MADYAEFESGHAPPWLAGPKGVAWWLVWGHFKDALAEGGKQAIKARMPLLGPPDALPALAEERSLERLPPDSETSWRERLAEAWELWALGGTKQGVLGAVQRIGLPAVTLEEAYEYDPGDPAWARFRVSVATPNPWLSDGLWSDPGFYDDGGTWDSTASPEEVQRVRRQVRLWKGAHTACDGVAVELSDLAIWMLWPV